eukprot:1469008-Rhodomonas_salina.1
MPLSMRHTADSTLAPESVPPTARQCPLQDLQQHVSRSQYRGSALLLGVDGRKHRDRVPVRLLHPRLH